MILYWEKNAVKHVLFQHKATNVLMKLIFMLPFMGKWLPSSEMDTVTRVQTLDETVYISHSLKPMQPTVLLPFKINSEEDWALFNLDMATSLKEGKPWVHTG